MAIHHEQRTVEWGLWSIVLMEPNPNPAHRRGDVAGQVVFPVAEPSRERRFARDIVAYRQVVDAWLSGMPRDIVDGLIPRGSSSVWRE